MASNNYAEVITDPIKAGQVLADFERLASAEATFKVLEFNPDTDRFEISCGRVSGLPPYPDVENSKGCALRRLLGPAGADGPHFLEFRVIAEQAVTSLARIL